MNMKTVCVIMTCFNRKEKTINCIESLQLGNPEVVFKYIIVDDCSSDGTVDELIKLPYDIEIITGNGHLFWNGGMHKGIEYVQRNKICNDYVMLVNDDVTFFEGCLEKLFFLCKSKNSSVVVGTLMDEEGQLSYGGIQYTSSKLIKYRVVSTEKAIECDTFNANCVLIPMKMFVNIGNLDPFYQHAMGDFDYGMHIIRQGYHIINSDFYVGICNTNSVIGSWQDTSLSRRKRLQLKEDCKGLPLRDWYYFAKKNFGLWAAIYHTFTPYARILLKK